MPLAFPSESHGIVAFGFFNIETDLLLLEQLFFFADRFCQAVVSLAEGAGEPRGEARLDGWRVAVREQVGDLHGAIEGLDLSGLIGGSYQRFPFPSRPEAFKQSPEGASNHAVMLPLVDRFGDREEIHLRWDRRAGKVTVSELVFSQAIFSTLIDYVDRGGYPRWKDERRPPYVQMMMRRLIEISSPLYPRAPC